MERLPQSTSPLVNGSQGGHTVHVVLGNVRRLLFLCRSLSVPGLHVTGSSDLARALKYVSRARPEVLICDLAMPEMGGEELLERLHEASPESRVILTSDRAGHPVVEHVGQGGSVDFMMGPLDTVGLLKAVDRILKKGA